MRKLKLDVEALQVESFATVDAARRGGTVQGRVDDGDLTVTLPADDSDNGFCYTKTTCIGPTYCCAATWRPTCAATCADTCANTCGWLCTWGQNTCATFDGAVTCDYASNCGGCPT